MSKLFFCSAPDPSGGAYSAPSGPLAGFGEPFRGRQERKGKGGDGGTGKEKRQGRERGEWRRVERASGNSFLPTPLRRDVSRLLWQIAEAESDEICVAAK